MPRPSLRSLARRELLDHPIPKEHLLPPGSPLCGSCAPGHHSRSERGRRTSFPTPALDVAQLLLVTIHRWAVTWPHRRPWRGVANVVTARQHLSAQTITVTVTGPAGPCAHTHTWLHPPRLSTQALPGPHSSLHTATVSLCPWRGQVTPPRSSRTESGAQSAGIRA